ncbi:OmpH family outer membrane protein [Sinobacterium caligoides]|nr:OmpH family outer membrane protein [Sinobacterium caligoides]
MSSAALAQGKIAVVNLEKAIFETQVAKTRMKTMQSSDDYKSSTAALKKLADEAKAMKARFDKDGAVMSKSQKEKLQGDFNSKMSDIQHEEAKLKKMGQAVYASVMRDMDGKVRTIMTEVVKKEKIGLLLDRQAAIHVDPEFDITSLITKRLNASK